MLIAFVFNTDNEAYTIFYMNDDDDDDDDDDVCTFLLTYFLLTVLIPTCLFLAFSCKFNNVPLIMTFLPMCHI